MIPPRPSSTLFPYTTLFRSELRHAIMRSGERELALDLLSARARRYGVRQRMLRSVRRGREFARHIAHVAMRSWTDRKSTRLNSSHTVISYAVFCLKKKNKAN